MWSVCRSVFTSTPSLMNHSLYSVYSVILFYQNMLCVNFEWIIFPLERSDRRSIGIYLSLACGDFPQTWRHRRVVTHLNNTTLQLLKMSIYVYFACKIKSRTFGSIYWGLWNKFFKINVQGRSTRSGVLNILPGGYNQPIKVSNFANCMALQNVKIKIK